jgi:hypothetical protein
MILFILVFLFKGKNEFLMKNLSRIKWLTVLFSIVTMAIFFFHPAGAQQGEKALGEARQHVAANGAYSFTADIEQTLIPCPVASMIGETSQRVDMRLDGDVILPDSAELQLRFEGEGANVQPLVFEQEGPDSYLLKDGERIKIDNPTAGAGAVDMGYLEQTGAAFYADDDYCDTCINDGLLWQINAFQTIQEAVDAAEAELLLVASDSLRYTVGVGPGTYVENVAMAPYVYIVGSDAETVMIDPLSAAAVTFSDSIGC